MNRRCLYYYKSAVILKNGSVKNCKRAIVEHVLYNKPIKRYSIFLICISLFNWPNVQCFLVFFMYYPIQSAPVFYTAPTVLKLQMFIC